jgi:hypothetical protein
MADAQRRRRRVMQQDFHVIIAIKRLKPRQQLCRPAELERSIGGADDVKEAISENEITFLIIWIVIPYFLF